MAQTITNAQVGITNPNEEPQQKQSAGNGTPSQPQQQSNMVGSGQTSGAGNTPIIGQQQAPTGQAARQGSGFTNLQSIIGANQNNNIGNTVATDLNNYTGQAQSGINNAQNTFNQQANQYNYNTSENQNAANSALNNIANGVTNVNPNTQNEFGTWINGAYQGPNSLSDVNAGLQNQVNNVSSLAKQGNSGLLQQFFGGNGNYTAGEQNLDNVLLNATGGNQVQQAKNNALGVTNQYNQANNAAQNQAQNIQQQNQAFSNQLLGNIGSGFQNIYNNAATSASSGGTDYNTEQKLINDIKSGNLTSQDINTLGLTSGEQTYGVNPDQFLNTSQPNVSVSQAMSPEQYAQLQALNSLSNGNLNSQAQQELGNINSSQVGTFNPTSVFNTTGFNNDIQQQASALQAAAAPLLSQNNANYAYANGNGQYVNTYVPTATTSAGGVLLPGQVLTNAQGWAGNETGMPTTLQPGANATAQQQALNQLLNQYNYNTTLGGVPNTPSEQQYAQAINSLEQGNANLQQYAEAQQALGNSFNVAPTSGNSLLNQIINGTYGQEQAHPILGS